MRAGRIGTHRTPSSFGGTLISPPPLDHVAEWLDNRVGFGKNTDAGSTSDYDVVLVTLDTTAGGATGATNDAVTTPGSLRWALAQTGKTIVRFAPGLGDITAGGKLADPTVAKPGWKCTANTLLDGYGYTGTLHGFVDSSNCDNFAGMYLSCTQPFNYGGNPSGGVFTAANCPRAYFWHVTGWDTGDIIFGSGVYALTANHATDQPTPYFATVDHCRFGPNPGVYAMMSPIKGTYFGTYHPGAYNAIDNDARNGKCINVAYDHGWIDGTAKTPPHPDDFPIFDQSAYVTFINSVYQGCIIRNGKGRSEFADIINNVITKYGTPYDLWLTADTTSGTDGKGDTKHLSTHYGAGASCDDDGVVNIEGNVFIPYANGEQVVGFQDAVADPLIAANPSYAMHRIRVGFLPNGSADPGGGAVNNIAIHVEGTAARNGNMRVGALTGGSVVNNNYVLGQTVASAAANNGFDRTNPNPVKIPSTDGYSLTVIDASVYANALAIVHALEDTAGTRAGNPWSTTQPPSWRDVDTIHTFPA